MLILYIVYNKYVVFKYKRMQHTHSLMVSDLWTALVYWRHMNSFNPVDVAALSRCIDGLIYAVVVAAGQITETVFISSLPQISHC